MQYEKKLRQVHLLRDYLAHGRDGPAWVKRRQIDHIMETRILNGGVINVHKERALSDNWLVVIKVTVKPSGLNLTKGMVGWILEGDCERDVFHKEGTQL